MNKSDEQIRHEIEQSDNLSIDKAIQLLRTHEQGIRERLADCAAALCGVDTDEMMHVQGKTRLAHARWLYWYAYRYMTNDSFEKIASLTNQRGHKFTSHAVMYATRKMAVMVENEPMWKKRWTIIRKFIKIQMESCCENVDNTITINIPKHLRDKINIQIKDK